MAYEDYQSYDPDGESIEDIIQRLNTYQKMIASTISDVEGNASQILQQADEINLRVDGVDTNIGGLDTRVSSAELKITAAAIVSTVTSSTAYISDIGGLDTRVSSAESSISQNANSISLKVSSTDYNGNTIASLINQTATTIKLQADNIDLLGITSVADTLNIGATLDTGAKSIRFNEGSGAVTIEKPAGVDSLRIVAGLGIVEFFTSSLGVYINDYKVLTTNSVVVAKFG